MRTFAPGGPGLIYQLKISLLEIAPPIWRRLHVPADLTLCDLALVLIETMGWNDSHLPQFTVSGVRYGEPDPVWDMEKIVDDATVSLREIVAAGAKEFRFQYDFGDGWDHSVDVDPQPEVEYPACVAGQRACPPEDCGGSSGYENLLEALADPEHEDREELLTWVGGSYDPEAFSVTRANVARARLARKRRKSAGRRPSLGVSRI
jgi:hypothetical protein